MGAYEYGLEVNAMTTTKQQRVNVTAASEAEFNMRVQELEKRGYTVKSIAPVEQPAEREINYDSTLRGRRKRQSVYTGFARHRAVMVREQSVEGKEGVGTN